MEAKSHRSEALGKEDGESLSFYEFIKSVSPEQLEATIQDLRENPERRAEIIEDVSEKNPDLMLELFRSNEDTTTETPELAHEVTRNGLVVLMALWENYQSQRDLESSIDHSMIHREVWP